MCFVMTKASLCLSQWISGTTKLLLWQTWQKWYLWQLPPMTHFQCTAQIIDFVRNGSALLSLERQQSTATQNKGTTFSFTFTLHPSNVHHTPSKSNPQMRCFWKFLSMIWNLFVSALSVLSLYLSGICCLPVCDISPLCLNWKTQVRTFYFRQAFPQTWVDLFCQQWLWCVWLWYTHVCEDTCMWVACASASSCCHMNFFCSARRFVLRKSKPIIIFI